MSGLRQQRKFSLWFPIVVAVAAAIALGNAFPAPAAREVSLTAFCAEFDPGAPKVC